MSTKIHHGYRLTRLGTNPGLAELVAFIQESQCGLFRLVCRRAQAAAVTHLVRESDRRAVGLEVDDPALFGAGVERALGEMRQRMVDASRAVSVGGTPLFDFRCSLVVLPDPDGGLPLALVFATDPTVEELAASALFLDPYPYWNNTDRPADVSDCEWQARADVWDRALAGSLIRHHTPAGNGLTFDLVPATQLTFPVSSSQFVPDRESRLADVAHDLYVERAFTQAFGDNKMTSGDTPAVMRCYQDAMARLDSDDGRAALQCIRAELEPRLPDDPLAALGHEAPA